MGTFFFRRKNKMKAVFASALVAAATALPWEDSQRIQKWSEPSIEYGVKGVSYDVSIPSNSQTNGNPTNWPVSGSDYYCYNWGVGRGMCRVKGPNGWIYTRWGENGSGAEAASSSQLNEFCKSCFGGDDVETTTKFCKACFGGDVEVQTKFCKACFGGDDAETPARFCKSCFGGDDAQVKARFCKSCFGGDVESTARFCKACFGGDDAEVHSRL